VKSKRNRPLNPRLLWEINFGIGVTGSTDHLIVKGILGRRFDWGHHKSEPSGWKSTPY
jgi:hypothetical protein